jgi:hypothetical protein
VPEQSVPLSGVVLDDALPLGQPVTKACPDGDVEGGNGWSLSRATSDRSTSAKRA